MKRERAMKLGAVPVLGLGFLICGCANSALSSRSPQKWGTYVMDRDGTSPHDNLESLRFRPQLCSGTRLEPEYQKLNERDLLDFLAVRQISFQLERARTDLIYVTVLGAETQYPVRLRVALLKTPDQAGRELHEALLQHGPGAWGVHRSNVAVLGPRGSTEDVLRFVGRTQLACWGVFTIAGRDDSFVIPGGYTQP